MLERIERLNGSLGCYELVMADQALASGSPGNNPRIPTSAEIIGLYCRVYG